MKTLTILSIMVVLLSLMSACSSTKNGKTAMAEDAKKNISLDSTERVAQGESLEPNNARYRAQGHLIGEHAATDEAIRRAVDSVLQKYPREDRVYLRAILGRYVHPNYRKGTIRIDRAMLAKDMGANTHLKSHSMGMQAGAIKAPQEFDTYLRVYKDDCVEKPGHYLPFLLNYDTIAQAICPKDQPVMTQEAFAFASSTIMREVLHYLYRNLLATGTFSWDERITAAKFFEELVAPKVSDVLYQVYALEMQKATEAPHGYPFYNYNRHRSSEIFIQLICGWMAGVADYALAFGCGTSEFAATETFFTNELGEVILANIVPEFQGILSKNVLFYQYDLVADTLLAIAKPMVDSIVVETREKKIARTDKFGSGSLTARASALYRVLAKFGVQADSLKVTVDHERLEWIVSLPDDPKFLGVRHYDHRLNYVFYSFDCPYPLKTIGERKTVASGDNLPSDGDLTPVLNNKIPYADIQNMAFAKKRLDREAVEKVIEPILKKIFEPVVYMPQSCYRVVFQFGGKRKVLIDSPCK